MINDSVFLKEIAGFKTNSHNSLWPEFNFHSDDNYEFDREGEFRCYDELIIEKQIEESFYELLSYVPDFKLLASSDMVKVKFDKSVYQDLINFLPNTFIHEGFIFICVDELLELKVL